MKQGGSMQAGGFTIVEVLIVLAISSLMLGIALAAVNGRQDKARFTTATNDFLQQVQQFENETGSGFSGVNNAQCAAGAPPTLGGANSNVYGGCVFIGKILQLGMTSINPQAAHVYPIIGNRQNPADQSQPANMIDQVYPQALDSSQGGNDLTLEGGLSLSTVSPMTYTQIGGGGGAIATRGFGFFSSLGDTGLDTANNVTGGSTEQLGLWAVNGSGGVMDESSMLPLMRATAVLKHAQFDQAQSVTFCLNSGTTNQSARYTIGTLSNPLAVTMTIFYQKDC